MYGIPILITKENCRKLNLNYYKKNLEIEILNSKNFKLNQHGVLKYVENILMGTSGILYENIKNLKNYPIANVPFTKKENKLPKFLLIWYPKIIINILVKLINKVVLM